MAGIRPDPVPCRFCGAPNAGHSVTIRMAGFVIWRASCGKCKELFRLKHAGCGGKEQK